MGVGMKELLADYIVSKVSTLIESHHGKSPFIIGLGSGTTAGLAVKMLGSKYSSKGFPFKAIATSFDSASIAISAGMDVLPLYSGAIPDFAFDGADEVDPNHRLIKGGGAQMTAEKIVSRRAGGITVIATAEKIVSKLGEKSPVPVEVLQIAVTDVTEYLKKESNILSIKMRTGSGKIGPLTTELGNFILDITYEGEIPSDSEHKLKLIPGVVETGLFFNDAREVVIARDNRLFRFLKGGKFEAV